MPLAPQRIAGADVEAASSASVKRAAFVADQYWNNGYYTDSALTVLRQIKYSFGGEAASIGASICEATAQRRQPPAAAYLNDDHRFLIPREEQPL